MSSENKSLIGLLAYLLLCAATLGLMCLLAELLMPRRTEEEMIEKLEKARPKEVMVWSGREYLLDTGTKIDGADYYEDDYGNRIAVSWDESRSGKRNDVVNIEYESTRHTRENGEFVPVTTLEQKREWENYWKERK